MSENTTNVEGLVYTAKDEASGVAEKIGHSFERVQHAAESAKEKIGEFAHHAAMGALASVGLGFGLHSLFEKATEANMEMARVNKTVAGAQYAFQGWKPGISSLDRMTYSMRQSAEIGEKLHHQALELREPIEQMGRIYNSVAAIGFGRLGMSQKGVLDLTEKLAAASKVYGVSAEEAVSTVNRALITGNIRAVGPFGIALRDALDIEHHKGGKKGAKLSPAQMFERMDKTLQGMVPAARMMGDNMAGSITEAKMLVDEIVRDLSGPLFREQTKSMSDWVQKIRSVREDGKSIMQIYGEKIASGFKLIKDVSGTIAEHWKLIAASMLAAKTSAMFLGGSAALGGLGGGAFGGAGGAASAMGIGELMWGRQLRGSMGELIMDSRSFSTRLNTATGGLGNFAGKLLAAAPALTALYVAADKAADWINERHDKQIDAATKIDIDTFNKLREHPVGTGEAHPGKALEAYLAMTGLGGKGGVDLRSATETFSAMDESSREAWANRLGSKLTEFVTAQGFGGGFQTKLNTDPEALAKLFGESVADTLMRESPLFGKGLGVLAGGDMTTWGQGVDSPNIRKHPGRGDTIINGGVHITQDFKEAAPNQVFHRVLNDIQDLVNAPSKARTGTSFAGGTG